MKRRQLLIAAPAALALPASGFAATAELITEQAIVAHSQEIASLLRDSAPTDTRLKGFQYMADEHGQVKPDSIWATVIGEDCRLHHMRPAVYPGWRVRRVEFV